jgi:hypothetical protein
MNYVHKAKVKELSENYDGLIFKGKCGIVFDTIVNYASRGRKYAA